MYMKTKIPLQTSFKNPYDKPILTGKPPTSTEKGYVAMTASWSFYPNTKEANNLVETIKNEKGALAVGSKKEDYLTIFENDFIPYVLSNFRVYDKVLQLYLNPAHLFNDENRKNKYRKIFELIALGKLFKYLDPNLPYNPVRPSYILEVGPVFKANTKSSKEIFNRENHTFYTDYFTEILWITSISVWKYNKETKQEYLYRIPSEELDSLIINI